MDEPIGYSEDFNFGVDYPGDDQGTYDDDEGDALSEVE